MTDTIAFYSTENAPCRFSFFEKAGKDARLRADHTGKIVRIISYCLMPTHIHLVLQQLQDGGITKFANQILKSHSKYFNVKYKRKGPLWEGRFKSVAVDKDEYLLHLTRYIHLNPVTACFVNKPEEWPYSSFMEYLTTSNKRGICDYNDILDIKAKAYRDFVEDRIDYQRKLSLLKKLWLE